MHVVVEIPEELAQSLGCTQDELRRRFAVDLALHYYATGLISLGKAVEVSGLQRWEFEQRLEEQRICRNYSMEDLDADLRWARNTEAR